jgi:hypothetical protein
MKNITTTTFVLSFLALSLTSVSAQSSISQGLGTIAGLVDTFTQTIVKSLGTLFISGGVVAFIFGLAKFIFGVRNGDTGVITNGKQFMTWSLVALFVMFSMYGIIKFFQVTFFGSDSTSNTIGVPEFRFNTGSSQTSPSSEAGLPTGSSVTPGSSSELPTPTGQTSPSSAVSSPTPSDGSPVIGPQ